MDKLYTWMVTELWADLVYEENKKNLNIDKKK